MKYWDCFIWDLMATHLVVLKLSSEISVIFAHQLLKFVPLFILGIKFDFREMLLGGAALDETGVPLPEETLSVAKQSDAILLGAIGG